MIKSFDICQFFCIFSQSPEPEPEPEPIIDVLDEESPILGEIVLILVSNIPEISERKKKYYKSYHKNKKIQSRKSKTVVCVIM